MQEYAKKYLKKISNNVFIFHEGGKTSKKYTIMNFVHDPPFLICISIPFFLYFHIFTKI